MKKLGYILCSVVLILVSCNKQEHLQEPIKKDSQEQVLHTLEDLIATGLGEVIDVPAGYELQNPEWPYLDVKLFVPYDGSTPHEVYVFTPEDIVEYQGTCDKTYSSTETSVSCKGSGNGCYTATDSHGDVHIYVCE